MGKRSDFERNDRDFYPTPKKGVIPVAPFLENKRYVEPCAGDGAIIRHLSELQPTATCIYACDLDPQAEGISQKNLILADWNKFLTYPDHDFDFFVTNPPWINTSKSNYQLFEIIKKLSSVKPTWLLLNGNFAFNKRSAPYMRMCSDIIPIGRLKWIEDSKHSGKEDCAWFLFDNTKNETQITYIHPRGA